LHKLSFIPLFYVRYVDDKALAALYNCRGKSIFHFRLKFTMEIGGMELNFLELINKDDWMTFN